MSDWRRRLMPARERGPWIVVLALTAAAVVLRVPGMTQSLALDEVYTFGDVHVKTLGALFSQLHSGPEANPPLYFVLAWATLHLGNHAAWIRVPSLFLGSAAVPLVYLLGRQTVGVRAGVVAAALMAISPFAMFYGNEGRAYATLIFLSALSTVVLLRSLDRRSARWWVLYGLSASAVIYTHYVGAFIIVAQALWAAWTHRDQSLALAASNGLAALTYLPWIPNVRPVGIGGYGGPLHPQLSTVNNVLAMFPGQPYSQVYRPTLSMLPGRGPLLLIAGGLLLALAARALPDGPTNPLPVSRHRSKLVLVTLLAVSCPIGMFLYSVTRHDVFLSRYFSASLPGLLLLVGWLLTSIPLRAALPAVGLVFAGMLVGTVKELEPSYARPPYNAVATFIAKQIHPTDPIVSGGLAYGGFLSAPLSIYLRGHHRRYDINDPTPWMAAARGDRVAAVAPASGYPLISATQAAEVPPGGCIHRVTYRSFVGIVRPTVAIYDFGGVCVYFGDGFSFPEMRGALQWRWSLKPTAKIIVVNRFSSPRRVTLSAALATRSRLRTTVVLHYGDGSSGRVSAARSSVLITRHLVVPPGMTVIPVSTRSAPLPVTVALQFGLRTINYTRVVYFRVMNPTVTTTTPNSTAPVR
jgi:hypothetical protein